MRKSFSITLKKENHSSHLIIDYHPKSTNGYDKLNQTRKNNNVQTRDQINLQKCMSVRGHSKIFYLLASLFRYHFTIYHSLSQPQTHFNGLNIFVNRDTSFICFPNQNLCVQMTVLKFGNKYAKTTGAKPMWFKGVHRYLVFSGCHRAIILNFKTECEIFFSASNFVERTVDIRLLSFAKQPYENPHPPRKLYVLTGS